MTTGATTPSKHRNFKSIDGSQNNHQNNGQTLMKRECNKENEARSQSYGNSNIGKGSQSMIGTMNYSN